jgi:hypothetical protein
MTEPDVALTDYGLAVECALFCWWLSRLNNPSPLKGWSVLFFAALVVASLAGGTVHGFFLDTASAGHRVLWPVTLIAIGAAALSAWMMGAALHDSPTLSRRLGRLAAFAFLIYCIVILFLFQSFIVAIAFYVPAAIFLLVVVAVRYARARERPALVAAAGMVLTFVASAVQVGRVAIDPVYFNHNALYHAIQAVALALLYFSLRHFIGGATSPVSSPC